MASQDARKRKYERSSHLRRHKYGRNMEPTRSTSHKCPYCTQDLPEHARARQRHLHACLLVHSQGCCATDEESDDIYIDDASSGGEEVPSAVVEDVHAWIEKLAAQETLSPEHMLKYINWGPLRLTQQEEDVAEFLSTVCNGTGMSDTSMNKLLLFWNKKNSQTTIPSHQETCWDIMATAHSRMTAVLKPRTVTVAIPVEVQKLLYEPISTFSWTFWNPCELLIRLLTMGPLAAMPGAFALFPEDSDSLDDFCHGDKMKRVFAALPRHTSCLISILFFDEINRDQKGYATGDEAIVIGAFFNKQARNSTYAKASIGTFAKLPIPKVRNVSFMLY
jgi:hypothetical protein